jgi:prenyltransferase/squalene oxidase-like repeat protein
MGCLLPQPGWVATVTVCLAASIHLLALPSLAQEPPTETALTQHLDAAHAPHLEVSRVVAIRGAVDWLVENQNADGSWGSHHSPRPIEVLCDVPGSHHAFRVATTALGVMALADSPYQSDLSRKAMHRGIDALLDQHLVKRPSGLEHYSVWAFGYCLQALAERLLQQPDDPRADDLRKVCRVMIQKLARYQALDGGWGYLSLDEVPTFQPSFTSMSFTTATCLIGLARAREAGFKVPEKMLRRAVSSVVRCETPAKAFTYGELWRKMPISSVNNLKGAACRGPVCLEAVALHGRARSDQRIEHALQALLIDHTRFQIAGLRRPIPHESHYGVSGYFYLYGHYYAAMAMQRLSLESQARWAEPLQTAVLLCRQPDGSFWDYPLYSYHKPYGTAFALMALSRLPATQTSVEAQAE